MKKALGLLLAALLAFAGYWLWRGSGSTEPASTAPASSPVIASSAAPLAPGWPQGDALRVTLKPDPGAVSLTKALYRDGDAVLEQRWPDGSTERWWYPPSAPSRYVGRDGREALAGVEVAP
ncbi:MULTISPECIES: hypothetical protein [unclassified Lysobacter]|uniref:hypothetical protein n=1 Tax=unclassified Lysobacter TaxID=2635362 RepID=UPI0006F258A6|nr:MULTISPECIES: hypothetical protein [unclassified Lysobacter]KQZ57486.1 hypothetical protein ASD53_07575 [Lysobacter sp. Root559]KRA79690.1 hypothetical protein ASD78_19115 [Lysobacter sp. Root667]KRC33635.1 hypothetical protein ASE10_11735 [Lysobacter sp. Root76]KRD68972.1 hypothetical protein ASE45_07185 [Lysobacter sp. Root96]